MSKLDYDCYAYFCIDHAHNTYPIRNAVHHLEQIFSIQQGDVLFLKGIGHLQVVRLSVDNYDWKTSNTDYLYQEIAIACQKVEY